MKKKLSIYIWLLGVMVFNCSCLFTVAQRVDLTQEARNQINNQEYLYAFGEATKLFLLGSYPQAISLYKECLRINPTSSASNFQLAKIFLLAGDVAQATDYARKACMNSPDNDWYLQELAQIYQVKQEYDSAIYIYEKIWQQGERNLNIAYVMASLYERVGKYSSALYYLENIDQEIGISKETAVARYRLYETMKLEKPALKQLHIALKLSDNEYSLLGMLAEYYRNNEQPDSAFYYYGKIYPTYRNDPVVVFSYSEFLMEKGLYDVALSIMIKAMRSDSVNQQVKTGYLYKTLQDESLLKLNKPILDSIIKTLYIKYSSDIRVMAVFADVELRLQNYNEASKALKKILFTDTKNYSAYEQLLFCENILGRTDSVLFFGSEAIKKFPEMPVPYLFCGSANYRKNQYNRAIQNLEKGLGFSQNENLKVEFYSLLAECYSKIQNNEKSDDFFEKALLINPRNSIVCNNYAYYLAEREENLSLALKLSEISLQSEPGSSTYLDTYGWILFKKNITRKAKRTIERAIELGGGKNGEILLHYGEILLTLKKYKRSLEVLNSALMYADEEQTKEINGLVNKARLKMNH